MSAQGKDISTSASCAVHDAPVGNGSVKDMLGDRLVDGVSSLTLKKSSSVLTKVVPGLIPTHLLAASDLFAIIGNGNAEVDTSRAATDRPTAVEDSRQPRTLSKSSCSGKDKTPMCLINELSRFNKLEPEYILTDERGPAHKKVFSVTLKLGGEAYSAIGHSIKKAQHNAAALALEGTSYRCPTLEAMKHRASATVFTSAGEHEQAATPTRPLLTPTVELNSLAARLGQRPHYYLLEPPPQAAAASAAFQGFHFPHQQPLFAVASTDFLGTFGHQFQGMMQPRFLPPRMPMPCHRQFCVALRVGDREFVAEGPTHQLARHNVAAKALSALRAAVAASESMLLPAYPPSSSVATGMRPAGLLEAAAKSQSVGTDSYRLPVSDEERSLPGGASPDSGPVCPLTTFQTKSEINALHEVARRHALTLNFEVSDEIGPPHRRHFVTRCTCGKLVTEGSGNSKRASKKDAASRMLELFRGRGVIGEAFSAIYPPQQHQQPLLLTRPPSAAADSEAPRPRSTSKNKTRSMMKMQKMSADYGSTGINPVTRLMQVQQARLESEPVYRELPAAAASEDHAPGRRDFTVQVTVGDKEAAGSGPSKRVAKQNAAEAMLAQLGCGRTQRAGFTSAAPTKSLLKASASATDAATEPLPQQQQTHSTSGSSEKRVTFVDQCSEPTEVVALPRVPRAVGCLPARPSTCPAKVLGIMAKELLECGASRTARALLARFGSGAVASDATEAVRSSRPKEQLEYLAHAAGLQLEFVDVPQGTSRDGHLALVTISTHPPLTNHGSGATVDESHDGAARAALQRLAAVAASSSELDSSACSRPIILRRPLPAAEDPCAANKQVVSPSSGRSMLAEQVVKPEQ